ncbi:MAG: hypothetical protein WKF36_10795 [Candidatus Nitrosocosmicus sp.]
MILLQTEVATKQLEGIGQANILRLLNDENNDCAYASLSKDTINMAT